MGFLFCGTHCITSKVQLFKYIKVSFHQEEKKHPLRVLNFELKYPACCNLIQWCKTNISMKALN